MNQTGAKDPKGTALEQKPEKRIQKNRGDRHRGDQLRDGPILRAAGGDIEGGPIGDQHRRKKKQHRIGSRGRKVENDAQNRENDPLDPVWQQIVEQYADCKQEKEIE